MTHFRVTRMWVARRRLGMTQAELARRVGVTQPRISSWERGLVEVPRRRRATIARVLDHAESTLTDEA